MRLICHFKSDHSPLGSSSVGRAIISGWPFCHGEPDSQKLASRSISLQFSRRGPALTLPYCPYTKSCGFSRCWPPGNEQPSFLLQWSGVLRWWRAVHEWNRHSPSKYWLVVHRRSHAVCEKLTPARLDRFISKVLQGLILVEDRPIQGVKTL